MNDAQDLDATPDALSYEERALGLHFSPEVTDFLSGSRNRHHGYVRAAQMLERETFAASQQCALIARTVDPAVSDAVRTLAGTRAGELLTVAGQCADAWTYYETVQDRPNAELVLLMCEAGFSDHARYIVTGAWADGEGQ